MKCLKRNKQNFEYLPYTGMDGDLNEYGEHTGEYEELHEGEPIPMKGNISVPSGRVNQTLYGQDIRYTHVLVMEGPDTIINEYGKIRFKGDMYDVQAVRPSLNFVSIALRKQTGNYPESDSE